MAEKSTTKKSRRGRKAETADRAAQAVDAALRAQEEALAEALKEDLSDGRLPSSKHHPLWAKRMEYEIQEASRLVVMKLWYPFEPEEHSESFSFDEVLKREAALDASDSPYAKWRYARHLEVEGICRDELIDRNLVVEG